MATPVLIATAGDPNANSYCTVAEANTYHDAHLYGTVWSEAETAQKTVALIWATRLLDEMCDWVGEKINSTQALRWPRGGAYDRDDYELDNASIPRFLVNATAELARHLLIKDRLQEMDENVAGLEAVKAGPVEVNFSSMDRIDLLPPSVDQMIKDFSKGASGSGMIVPLERA